MSAIGWIDFSSERRDKVHTVIDLLSEDGVIDELDIGVIRDSFADSMFPGISTIQTRPKCFTLTALLLKDFIATNKNRRQKLGRYLEENEKTCRIQLVKNAHERGGKDQGIIRSAVFQLLSHMRRNRGCGRELLLYLFGRLKKTSLFKLIRIVARDSFPRAHGQVDQTEPRTGQRLRKSGSPR